MTDLDETAVQLRIVESEAEEEAAQEEKKKQEAKEKKRQGIEE